MKKNSIKKCQKLKNFQNFSQLDLLNDSKGCKNNLENLAAQPQNKL